MVTFMLACVSLILVAYFLVYIYMISEAVDPNLSVMVKEKDDEIAVSIFLLT